MASDALGLAFCVCFFALGWLVFTRKIRVRSWSRQSPSFQRFFPKLWGGIVMAITSYAAVGALLGLSGILHQKVLKRWGTQPPGYADDRAVIVGMILFAVVGIAFAVVQMAKPQWDRGIVVLLEVVGVEMGYASMVLHQSALSIAATVIVVVGAALASQAILRDARKTEQRRAD